MPVLNKKTAKQKNVDEKNKIYNDFCTNIAEAGGEGEKRAISLQSKAAKYP